MAFALVNHIVNARIPGREGLWDVGIENQKFGSIVRSAGTNVPTSEGTLDAKGCLLCPPLCEPHVHLDTTLTAGEPEWNRTGTLFEGVQRWAQRKESLSFDDVTNRARTAISWYVANGVQFIRTHCDVTDPKLVALHALLSLKQELSELVTLQIVAFPQEGICSYPRGAELVEEALRLGADVVGATPHLEFTRDDGVKAVKTAFDLAERYDSLVDIHCDEIDDEQSRFLEVVAAEAHHRKMGQRVTASHTTAMGSYNDAYAFKLMRVLSLAGLSFVANPLVNIHLQGRFDTYPKRRGLTRVKELLAQGINVCFGHDDLSDPWYPIGTANMLQVLHMGLHVCHLTGYDELNDSLKLVTSHSARALNLGDAYGIEVGRPASAVLLNATSDYDAVRRQSVVLQSVRLGRTIAQTVPSETSISWGGERRLVSFDAAAALPKYGA
jgi:cytosine/creatinine deaminase